MKRANAVCQEAPDRATCAQRPSQLSSATDARHARASVGNGVPDDRTDDIDAHGPDGAEGALDLHLALDLHHHLADAEGLGRVDGGLDRVVGVREQLAIALLGGAPDDASLGRRVPERHMGVVVCALDVEHADLARHGLPLAGLGLEGGPVLVPELTAQPEDGGGADAGGQDAGRAAGLIGLSRLARHAHQVHDGGRRVGRQEARPAALWRCEGRGLGSQACGHKAERQAGHRCGMPSVPYSMFATATGR
mmetsp:Transcript_22097/g.58333  ORF Transcript_22097/g.58333 Transcript_22097/m.58333 type:complete len:250 (-) Transcript_22097:35-784(-)